MRGVALTAGLMLLAACGKGAGGNETAGNASAGGNLSAAFDDGFRSSYRTKFVESCTTGAKSAAERSGNAAAAALNYTPLCGCAADKLLATKSVGELMRGPSEADQLAVTQACVKEHPPV